MTIGDVLGLSAASERYLVRTMQVLLTGLLVYGLLTFQFGMAANGGTALAVTLLPALLRREYTYSMDVGLVLWITTAVFLHSVGSALSLYGGSTLYDNLTHLVSSTVIAGVGYASFRAFEQHSDDLDVPPAFRAVFIVIFVLAAGVFWEIVEFASSGLAALGGGRAPLVVYGIDDIVSDLISNTVGAVLVAAGGTGHFSGLTGFLRRRIAPEDDQ